MTIDEVAQIYERQFGGRFPCENDENEDTFTVMTANDLYQFAHAVVREHLAKQLEKAYGSTNT
jgi:hypothetical protein